MFLLGAFLTGGAVGFAADRAVTRAQPEKQYDERAGRDSPAQELKPQPTRAGSSTGLDWRRARPEKSCRPIALPLIRSVSARVDACRAGSRAAARFNALIERNQRWTDSVTCPRRPPMNRRLTSIRTAWFAGAVLMAAPLAAQGVSADDGARPVTLQEAVALAMKNAPAAVQARGLERNAGAARRQAVGAYVPSVNLSAGTDVRRVPPSTSTAS
jgi:hypothetical protein